MILNALVQPLMSQPLSKSQHQQLVETLLSTPLSESLFQDILPLPVVDQFVLLLKEQADKHWSIDPQISLQCSDKIIQLGRLHHQKQHEALGKMARGDALKFIGHNQHAWDSLEEAGCLFLDAHDDVGWARTQIGKMWLSTELGQSERAFQDAERAKAIFEAHGNQTMLMRLLWNTAAAHNHLGSYHHAMALYFKAYQIAQALGEDGAASQGPLCSNIGYSHLYLGNLDDAEYYFQYALDLHRQRGQERAVVIEQCNLAKIAQIRGQYQSALDVLHAVEQMDRAGLDDVRIFARRQMAECYLALNRFEDARRLAFQVIEHFETQGATYRGVALALICLAEAETRLGHFDAAVQALQRAEDIYSAQAADSWVAVIKLKHGHIALDQGNAQTAYENAEAALVSFKAHGRSADQIEAELVLARAQMMSQNFAEAQAILEDVLRSTREKGMRSPHYTAHILSGQLCEDTGDLQAAVDHYEAAIALVEEMQGSLMMTLHQGFLQRQNTPFQALIRLYLRVGAAERAFNTLERMKTQVILGWFTNREHLLWQYQDEYAYQLFQELKTLKDQHHWHYQSLYTQTLLTEGRVFPKSSQVLADLAALEDKIRQVAEAIHVHSAHPYGKTLYGADSLETIQAALPEDTALVEYYIAENQVWAFVLADGALTVRCLPVVPDAIPVMIQKLYNNIDRALSLSVNTPALVNMTRLFCKLSADLYRGLIAPLCDTLVAFKRLIFIPYGALHYLPFNLLYDDRQCTYLISQFEIALQPAATFITRPLTNQRAGGTVLANSWDDRIPHVIEEAETVARLIRPPVNTALAACMDDLKQRPTQILHIAAHGEYRMDRPEFSYIQLADGQLMFEDVLQHDLTYELVILSGCETGRATMTTADEAIGLGFGFLYAGADTLIVSLWRVHDVLTKELMTHVYQALMNGRRRGEALRHAQRQMFEALPHLHPAFWGAFQLIGCASFLSDSIQ